VAAYHVVQESVVERVVGYVCVVRRTHSQLLSPQQIPAQHDMLPQHIVYKNELNCEYVITLARTTKLPDDDLKRSKHVGVVLSVLSESYIGAFFG